LSIIGNGRVGRVPRFTLARLTVVLGVGPALLLAACTSEPDTTVSAAETTLTDGGEIVAGEDDGTGITAARSDESDVEVVAGDGEPDAVGQGSSGPADGDQPDLRQPDEVIAEIESALDGQPVSGADVLDTIDPLDGKPTSSEIDAVRARREGILDPAADGPRNESGELAQLDEPAALACADVERALTAVDEGSTGIAVEEIESAATRAAESSIEDISVWSETLSGSWTGDGGDPVVLLGFLSICTKGGYEL
jgi:hypothetical protein